MRVALSMLVSGVSTIALFFTPPSLVHVVSVHHVGFVHVSLMSAMPLRYARDARFEAVEVRHQPQSAKVCTTFDHHFKPPFCRFAIALFCSFSHKSPPPATPNPPRHKQTRLPRVTELSVPGGWRSSLAMRTRKTAMATTALITSSSR